MATIKLIPSAYFLSDSSALTVTNPNNMYIDTDSTTYATVKNNKSNQTEYYFYITDFDFSSIPSNAIVNNFTIKVKASVTNNKSSVSDPRICDGTTVLTGTASASLSSTATVITFSGVTASWDTIKSYGSHFAIRLSSGKAWMWAANSILVYGAEIEVDYTIPTGDKIYIKVNGTWNEYSKVYIKENGSWVEKSTDQISTILNTTANYVKSS